MHQLARRGLQLARSRNIIKPPTRTSLVALITTMATPYRIQLGPKDTGLLKFGQTESTAKTASDLLQKDLETHHVFFNSSGFHNHIVHHILALYGTGAGTDSLVKGYDDNASYQLPPVPTHSSVVDELSDWTKAQEYLGNDGHYADFLVFYQREIDRLGGWRECLAEHLFNSASPRAEETLQRMFSGFLHPLIQLMYGVEWSQPAVVAEALAQACVHKNRLRGFLVESERRSLDETGTAPAVMELVAEAGRDAKISAAAHAGDDNKIYDGILVRAPDETVALCGRVRVNAEELEERTAEMFHAAILVAAAAAIHPPKEPRFDFFLMHHVNAAPIFVTLNRQDWITTADKVRILEWKIRMDIVEYAARRCPKLDVDAVLSYTPLDATLVQTPEELFPRMHATPDDGHAIKLARAVQVCKEISAKFADRPWAKIKSDDDWLRVMYLVLDSVEGKGMAQQWVRGAGFEDSWKDVPDRK